VGVENQNGRAWHQPPCERDMRRVGVDNQNGRAWHYPARHEESGCSKSKWQGLAPHCET